MSEIKTVAVKTCALLDREYGELCEVLFWLSEGGDWYGALIDIHAKGHLYTERFFSKDTSRATLTALLGKMDAHLGKVGWSLRELSWSKREYDSQGQPAGTQILRLPDEAKENLEYLAAFLAYHVHQIKGVE